MDLGRGHHKGAIFDWVFGELVMDLLLVAEIGWRVLIFTLDSLKDRLRNYTSLDKETIRDWRLIIGVQ